MKSKRNLLAVAAGLVACIVVVWFSTSSQGGEETYEIHPYVAVPYGYTPTMDAYRLIDLIEQLTAQNNQITQNKLNELNKDIKGIVEKLDSIDAKFKDLFAQMTRIEKALGTEHPKPPTDQKSSPNRLRRNP